MTNLAGGSVKLDGQGSAVEVDLEFRLVGSGSQAFVERLKRLIRSLFELLIVHRSGLTLDSSETREGQGAVALAILKSWQENGSR